MTEAQGQRSGPPAGMAPGSAAPGNAAPPVGDLPGPGHGVAGTGLRRVDWVRLRVGERGPQAEAVGVGFRLPATRPIPLSTAARLVASGTPCVTSWPSGRA